MPSASSSSAVATRHRRARNCAPRGGGVFFSRTSPARPANWVRCSAGGDRGRPGQRRVPAGAAARRHAAAAVLAHRRHRQLGDGDPCTGCRDAAPLQRFEPARSQTFERLRRERGLLLRDCDAASECGYRVAYQEGSSYSGYLALDTIRVGQGGACVHSSFLGCSTEETGLFTRSRRTASWASPRRAGAAACPTRRCSRRSSAQIVPDAFSLCFGAAHAVLCGVPPDAAGARRARRRTRGSGRR